MKSKLNSIFGLAALIILFAISIQPVHAQTNKFYIAMSDIGPSTKALMASKNIQNIPLISGKEINPASEKTLDVESFTNAVNKHIPDANASGYAVIDWEGQIEVDLIFKPRNSDEYKNALTQYTNAIRLAKKLRPNMKWGFFGLPFQPYKGDKRMANVDIPLNSECDAFFPQLYFNYNADNANGRRSRSEKRDWLDFYLKNILAMASKMNKPVLAFIWHRYYSAGFKQNSLKLIPLDEFNDYVKESMAYSYNGKSLDGVILWGNDTYFYTTKSQPLVDEFKATGGSDFKAYHDTLIYRYINKLNTTVNQGH